MAEPTDAQRHDVRRVWRYGLNRTGNPAILERRTRSNT